MDLHIVSYKRLLVILAENPLCLTFIDYAVFSADIVKSGDPFYDLSCHRSLCLFKSQGIGAKLLEASVYQFIYV